MNQSRLAERIRKIESSIARTAYGWYNVFGQGIDAMKKLFLKIGADYALTTETRRVASALS